MPGLIYSSGVSSTKREELCKPLCFDNRYYQTELFRNENDSVLFNGYKEYPLNSITAAPWTCCMEGMIYNAETKIVLNAIISQIANGPSTKIAELIKPLDGEFLIILRNEDTGEVYIINDSQGRLPVYIYRNAKTLIVSREISFVLRFIGQPSYIKTNVALYLMFGFTFGITTIWKDIERLEPHSIIQFNSVSKKYQNQSFFNLDIGSENSDNTSEIFENFKIALQNRLDNLKNPSISLSGGLDSRLVAGFTAELKAKISFTTFERYDGASDLDLICAKQILKNLSYSKLHDIVKTPESTIGDLAYVLRIKCGMNNGAMGFILPYYRYLESQNRSTITGDGGDKYFVNLHPYKYLKSEDKLTSYLLSNVSNLKVGEAAMLSGANENDILNTISNRLKSYKVGSWNDAYAYFMIRERGMNWVFEGEDRTRYLVWTTSPFYNPRVIDASMKLALQKKRHGRLFTSLFKLLPGNLETVLNPNWQLTPNNKTGVHVLFFKQKLKARFRNLVPIRRDISVQYFEQEQFLKKFLENASALSPIKVDLLQFEKLTFQDIVKWRLLSILFHENDKEPSKPF